MPVHPDRAAAGDVLHRAAERPARSARTSSPRCSTPNPWAGWWVVSWLAWGLGYIGLPHSVMRYKAMRSAKDIPVFRDTLMVWSLLIYVGSMCIGLLARQWYVPGDGHLDGGSDAADAGRCSSIPGSSAWRWRRFMAAVDEHGGQPAAAGLGEHQRGPPRPGLPGHDLRAAAVDQPFWWWLLITVFSLVLVLQGGNSILSLVTYAWAGLGAAFGACPAVCPCSGAGSTHIGAIAGVRPRRDRHHRVSPLSADRGPV